ncbi:hypothetical protein HED22_11070 [Thalassospira sp. HF15]|uniref:hypothetical protein n=1 Tax=Thalassospira sp. HF15 TaxID=2722755 RepID=UPI001431F4F5|nr:hypothetical protein [Thalassospira sp. HF15]NIY76184.1 hypothetical protein [Thalassospira sp. HF15]
MAHTVSAAPQFNVSADPFTKRMPFGSLLSQITAKIGPARAHKAASYGWDSLSHAELADLGLQRKFNGSTWYVDRIKG